MRRGCRSVLDGAVVHQVRRCHPNPGAVPAVGRRVACRRLSMQPGPARRPGNKEQPAATTVAAGSAVPGNRGIERSAGWSATTPGYWAAPVLPVRAAFRPDIPGRPDLGIPVPNCPGPADRSVGGAPPGGMGIRRPDGGRPSLSRRNRRWSAGPAARPGRPVTRRSARTGGASAADPSYPSSSCNYLSAHGPRSVWRCTGLLTSCP